LAEEGFSARVFAVDQHGGYLIYRFNGRLKVFIDGRVDFYGASFVEDYVTMLLAKPGWRTLFERHHFTHALLPGDAALLDALRREGWRKIVSDPVAVLLRAPASGTVLADPVPDPFDR